MRSDSSRGYIEVPHPADIAFDVYGTTIEDLFQQAVFAMKEYVQMQPSNGETIVKEINLKDIDYESLLVLFLNEILFLIEMDLIPNISSMRIKPYEVQAFVNLKPCKKRNKEIKAVTYHQLSISEENGFKTRVVFDV